MDEEKQNETKYLVKLCLVFSKLQYIERQTYQTLSRLYLYMQKNI